MSSAAAGTYTYMVRAVKLETSASGSYFNASQGIFEDANAGSGSLDGRSLASPPTRRRSPPSPSAAHLLCAFRVERRSGGRDRRRADAFRAGGSHVRVRLARVALSRRSRHVRRGTSRARRPRGLHDLVTATAAGNVRGEHARDGCAVGSLFRQTTPRARRSPSSRSAAATTPALLIGQSIDARPVDHADGHDHVDRRRPADRNRDVQGRRDESRLTSRRRGRAGHSVDVDADRRHALDHGLLRWRHAFRLEHLHRRSPRRSGRTRRPRSLPR